MTLSGMEPPIVGSDGELVARVAHGDEQALGELRARHAGSVYAIAFGVLGNAPDSEHVLSETFLEAWRTAVDFQAQIGSVHAWLSAIARRRARGLTRERGHGLRRVPQVAPQTMA